MLLTLPPELLTRVALHLATAPPNLGPPAALIPLLATCRRLYDLLGWNGKGRNTAFWARVGRAKFAFALEEEGEAAYVPYEGYPFVGLDCDCDYDDRRSSTTEYLAYSLRTRCAALALIRAGDPFAPGAARALRVAYGMLLEDDWEGERLDWSALDLALGREPLQARPSTSPDPRRGKNRRQLTWANARTFALRYVRERLYLGRYGDLDPEDDSDEFPSPPHSLHAAELRTEWRKEWRERAWQVGWPRDAEGTAAALWVVWFFEGEETLRAEPEDFRRLIMNLLLPLVAAPFRYASALAPPHHYTVPLLPAVYASAAFETQVDVGEQGRGITVPTHHGAYPNYALGAPRKQEQEDAAPAPPRCSRSMSPSRSRSASPRRPSAPSASAHRRPLRRQHHQRRSRILAAPPARLLYFARMQVGARMGVPPHLARDRAEAGERWRAGGNTGPMPICPTQEDVGEKNARPLVRFERGLGPAASSSPSTPSTAPASTSTAAASTSTAAASTSTAPVDAPALTTAETLALLAVDPELDLDDSTEERRKRRRRDERWAPYRWRSRLCRGYEGSGARPRGRAGSGSGRGTTTTAPATTTTASVAPPPASMSTAQAPAPTPRPAQTQTQTQSRTQSPRQGGSQRQGKGGAPPGRIGRVYTLGSFAGLWAGTMLMPSEPPYNALVAMPGGAFPAGGLPRDDFVAAARPVYMRVREHWRCVSFLPHFSSLLLLSSCACQPTSSFHPDTAAPPPPADSTTADEGLHNGWLPPGTRVVGVGANKVEVRVPASASLSHGAEAYGRGEERAYTYHTALGLPGAHAAHDRDVCPGCVGARERARWARARARGVGGAAAADEDAMEDVDMEDVDVDDDGEELPAQSASPSVASASTSSEDDTSRAPDDAAPWPEWDAPAWKGHRFDADEGWEWECDGVQDVIFEGETDMRHGMAWHHYEYAGRVRPWDGLIGLIMRPRDRTLGLATFFISGNLVGRDTFEGTWMMAAQDVLAPSWGGSVCLARGED
ncbi:hypothetical protein C8R45DRAFT_117229 [Mycena sanguinolenta]|nr:hypothetical protein C8R45DRAFT_117229 [Mycena sanguinolenta]